VQENLRVGAGHRCPFAAPGISFAPPGRKRGKKGRGPFSLIRFPRVPRRAAERPRRCTRGYNPPPRWGEKGKKGQRVHGAIACGARLIGINNRDLTTFTVDLATTERLSPPILAANRVLVSESGIKTPADVRRLLAAGTDAILVGETLLKSSNLSALLADFKQSSLEP